MVYIKKYKYVKKAGQKAGIMILLIWVKFMIRIATVFSGIGSPEHALKKIGLKHKLIFACDNGERELKLTKEEIEKKIKDMTETEKKYYIDNLYDKTGKENFMQHSYTANYKLNNDDFHQDIRFLNGNNYKNQVDLFVGGSPCQSFSISGKRLGFEDTRGTLFYEFARLVKEIQPKVFIYENVPGMLNHDGGKTWEVISNVFDQLNYKWRMFKLCAKDFGIPQNRTRIYVVAFRNDLNILPPADIPKKKLDKKLKDFLEKNVDYKYYHGEKGFNWITKPLSLKKRVSINADIARTQAANQQFNWCGDMIFEKYNANKNYPKEVYIGKYMGEKGVARKLTPRECLRLMGYTDDFKIVVPDQQMYRQSGNSIVVNVLEAIIKEILKTDVFKERNND